MVNKINIAYKNKDSQVEVRMSKVLFGILTVLYQKGVISSYSVNSKDKDVNVKSVILYLKYYNVCQ